MPPLAAARYNDLYRFSPSANTWTELFPYGSVPSPRSQIGFVATPDGMLYMFGGYDGSGKGRRFSVLFWCISIVGGWACDDQLCCMLLIYGSDFVLDIS